MLVAAAVADLDEAEPVAAGQEPHRLGVDGDRAGREDAFGQVLFMEMDCHWVRIGRSAAGLNRWSLAMAEGRRRSTFVIPDLIRDP
jgi:hypothetical protein